MPKTKTKPGSSAAKKRTRMADGADRHALYQSAVQCVESEIDFVDETFTKLRGTLATTLREDFCGTANTSCEWVRRRDTNRAVGVDLDPDPLEWGRKHNITALPPGAQDRVRLLEENVLTTSAEQTDIVLAMNFSYFIFKERATMVRYFESVRDSLRDNGIMFLDCYGGYEAFMVTRDRREVSKKVTYIWDQADYNPITGEMQCYIHFRFSDGSKINKAFSYNWRLWTLPEIQEMLAEAGFTKSTVYWEGWDEEEEEGNGEFEPVTEVEQDPSWICYVVAEK